MTKSEGDERRPSTIMTADAPAGSHWKALQQQMQGPRKKRSTRSLHAKAEVVSTSATDALPWFAEDLAPGDLALAMSEAPSTATAEARKRQVLGEPYNATAAKREPGHYLAIDCEMVGVGPRGTGSHLARVSIVNWYGHVVLDTFVRPRERVTDFRTWVSGVRPSDLKHAPPLAEVQARVAELIKGRVLVGHAIHNDLKALLLSHPRHKIRDTSTFQPLRELAGNKQPGLRTLARLVLDIEIQAKHAAHSPVEDAQATMAVFRTQKAAWDASLGIGVKKHDAPRRTPSLRRPKSTEGWWEEEAAL